MDRDISRNAINWYPGHMNKARIMMEENIRLCDLVIEIVDARAPLSSRNPDIDRIGKGKGRVVILNKSDLSDPALNEKWRTFFNSKGIQAVLLDSKGKKGLKNVLPAAKAACAAKISKDKSKGIVNTTLKAMVVGIPNVGKSTFINAFVGKNVATTGNKPGVTKGKQWISINKELELLDTPGILWPKFEDQEVGRKLAYLGSINDEILVTEELAGDLLFQLYRDYPQLLEARYKITADVYDGDDGGFSNPRSRMLDHIAKSRGCLKKGGEVDYFKTAGVVLDDFRSGRIGSITLERP